MPLEPLSGGVVIDLEALRFAAPTLALRLVASKAVHESAGEPFAVNPPRDRRARRYLARAGLADLIGEEPASQADDVLLPVERIQRSRGVEHAGEALQRAAKSLPARLAMTTEALVSALSELGGNACSHGKNDHGTFLLAQRFGRSGLVLAVGDLGVGIPVHLGGALENGGKAEPAELIAAALRPGVSGVPENQRDGEHGKGLPETLEKLRRLEMPAAELTIWSGLGRVSVQMRAQPSPRRYVKNIRSYTRGTWVEVILTSS